MKALFKNKKLMTGIIATMIGVTILLAGLTLAWFTSSGSTSTNNVTMGSLDVTAKVHNYNTIVAQPGIDIPDQLASVQNLGTLPALAKLTFDVQINNGSGWGPAAPGLVEVDFQVEGSKWAVDEDGKPVTVHEMGFWTHANGESFYSWGTYDGDLYVAMQGNDRLHFAYTVTPKGGPTGMGNDYQGAEIRVLVKWEATQLWADGAIFDTFGIDYFDIDWFVDLYDVFLPDLTVFSFPIGGPPNYAARYAETLENMPNSSFKSFVVDMLGA